MSSRLVGVSIGHSGLSLTSSFGSRWYLSDNRFIEIMSMVEVAGAAPAAVIETEAKVSAVHIDGLVSWVIYAICFSGLCWV